MSLLVVPNTFANGTGPSSIIDATQMNANFTAVATAVNNIYPSQILPITTGQATFGATATGVGYKFLANDATAVPLTISGVSGQTADIFDVTNTSGTTPVFSVSRANNTAIQALIVTPSNAPSFPSVFAVGDGAVQRSASTGFQWWGGASGAGGIEWNITNSASFSLRNITNNGYVPMSGGTYTTISDASTKADVAPIADALTIIAQLKPSSYTVIATGKPGFGLIAQDVANVLPACTRTDNNGDMGVAYTDVLAHLIAAFQDYVTAHP